MKWLLLLLVLMVACAQPQITARPEPSDEIVSVPVVQQENASPTSVSKPEEQVADIDELKALLLKGVEGTQFHVTLEVTVTGKNNINSVTDIFVKNQKTRVDTQANFDGEEISTAVIILDETMVQCVNRGSWECEEFPVDKEAVKLATEQLREQLDNSSFYTTISRTNDRELAGVSAKCYLITLPNMPVQEQCYSDEGAVLYQEFTIEGDHVIHKATAYTTVVSDKDFTAPADIS